jgi:hypothetical protein
MDLVHMMGHETLPLAVHQAVLRKCTSSTIAVRISMAGNLQQKKVSYRKPFHIHEVRFQTVIRNIRAAGYTPSLDDFHFILKHFAAVGHYLGAHGVLNELLELGIKPTHKTFGLCLQSLAHRLSLPYPEWHRPAFVARLSYLCSQLLSDMQKYGVPVTSVNFDLVVRVLREGGEEEGLAKLLKVGYGIDLRYLDRPPLEDVQQEALTETTTGGTVTEVTEQVRAGSFAVQPFSTAVLNTVIDILGRRGNLSQMVSFFETITTPLPFNAVNVNYASSYEDDEDDDYSIPLSRPSWEPPYAEPNTTTYNMLVKYAAKGKNYTLAKHYVERMFDAEHFNRRRIRDDLRVKPMSEVVATRIALNRGSLIPVYGMGHRDHNREVMRYVRISCKKALRRKKRDLKYYSGLKERLAGQVADGDEPGVVSTETPITTPAENSSSSDNIESLSPPSSTTFTEGDPDFSPVLDVDLDKVFTPLPPKTFNLDLHLSILRRDISELEELKKRNSNHLHRAVSRNKQRLGRRIWTGKDVYLVSERSRVKVSPENWKTLVNFQYDKLNRSRR